MDRSIGACAHGEPLIRTLQIRSRIEGWGKLLAGESASQIVEFAVALPLLVVFVVGIFDFSNAFTLKQKLTNVARDAARAAASDPSNDLTQYSSVAPGSVTDAFQTIDSYLVSNNMNDCGVTLSGAPAGLTWTFTGSSNGCPAVGLTIIVNRGYYYPASGSSAPAANCQPQGLGGNTAVISTCVTIEYPYVWKFGRAASLLGANATLPTQITATGVAMNEN